ncbi:hypothetical protein SAMN05216438_10811 [Lactococcus garvieae]|uniref:DUF3789 domain-containing protein n=1 Tax=Lactococcus garvieae TaxID=1363 RepID=A0A1I4HB54_9LACT|nr:hypothetical protein SAMN05216438_10811 [Lactococcus garvieae]
MMDRFELAVCLFIVVIGSFMAGAACVGIQLEKVKKQRDEALKRLEKK